MSLFPRTPETPALVLAAIVATVACTGVTACGPTLVRSSVAALHNSSETPLVVSSLPPFAQAEAERMGWSQKLTSTAPTMNVQPSKSSVIWPAGGGGLRWVQPSKSAPFILAPSPLQGPHTSHWPRWFRSFNGRGAAIVGDTFVRFEPRGKGAGYVVGTKPGAPKHPDRLQILVYNAFFLDGLFATDVERRGPALIQYLQAGHQTMGNWDVLVLPELFHDGVREQVLARMRDRYPYATTVLGGDRVRIGNGGVLVLSRWPILVEDEVIFDDCTDYDCGAAKGGRYVRILKGARTFHLVATHMQSRNWPRAQRIRQRQVQQLAELANAQHIRPHEPLIYAGDFNIDALQPGAGPGLGHAEMLFRLDGEAVAPPNDALCQFSYDPRNNRTALLSYETGWRDQVVVSRHRPASSVRSALEFPVVVDGPEPTFRRLPRCDSPRQGALDLSDHYAVTVRLSFPAVTR